MELPDLNELDDIILTIEEEDGTETEVVVVAMFEYDDETFAAVTPTDEDAAEVYLFGAQCEDKGDELEFTLENIDDEERLEEVGRVFTQIMEEAAADDDDDDESEIEVSEDSDEWDEFIHKKIDDLP